MLKFYQITNFLGGGGGWMGEGINFLLYSFFLSLLFLLFPLVYDIEHSQFHFLLLLMVNMFYYMCYTFSGKICTSIHTVSRLITIICIE